MKISLEDKKIIIESKYNKDEINDYINEEKYLEEMNEKVQIYLKDKVKTGKIKGKNDLELYYETYIVNNPKGNIVISHGFGEFIDKYYELIYYFMKEGYSIFIMEHRGNARSQRLGKDDTQISVEKFQYYIDDFKKFIDEVVKKNSFDKKLLLFGHSMGGGIGTLFLEQYPDYFKGAVLSSPMHEINSGKTPKFLAILICTAMNLFRKGKEYIPGQTPYKDEFRFPNRTTSSKSRYRYQYNKIKENKEYQTGGASAKWYLESLIATRKLRSKKNASKIDIPLLLIQAGKDTHVLPEAHYKVVKYSKNAKVLIVKDAKHEAFFERDDISFSVIEEIKKFYKSIR